MTDLLLPPGFGTGCLPRKSQYGSLACAAPLADRMDVIKQADWDDFLTEMEEPVDLKPFSTFTYNQASWNSCAAESVTGACNTISEANGKTFELLNPWSMYAYTSGGRDAGSYIDENATWLATNGILPDSVWQRYNENGRVVNPWNKKPPMSLFEEHGRKMREWCDIDTDDEFGTALLSGRPVVFGYKIGRGGHAVYATRLFRQGRNWMIEWHNSWDVTWGNKGFGVMPLSNVSSGFGTFCPFNTNYDAETEPSLHTAV